ncbi:uncharacterized protein PF11_0213-like isoform X2 [Leptopilina heterotoma]|uniref:uncharacterized protein PF11_0213-like isoform X2 n=1 Tax=Leptopilina heterotoma TaxID=63436 RepID=UPI001CA960CF|nr:uncharacterized protein PF11_0213-like isoform X2 [Leptopilina heterotoma]
MSYSRNIPDWQQYNALQSGGSDAAKSGQNISSSHLYVPNISPSSMNGLNLSSDCLSKSQNDVINYSQRNYQPPNNTPSGPNSLVEPPLTSLVHMSSCVGHYGASSSMNSMLDDSSNVDLRNGSVASLSEEMAHRNQISLNGPVPRVVGPNMNVASNVGSAGTRIPPANTVPSSRQGPYMPACKGPCCVSDPNVNYQSWEKFPNYQSNNPYRENLRASGYANEPRRYRNDMAYRKESYPSKDLIPPNSYHVDQRRNFTDYKYCKEPPPPPPPPPVPRNYQPPAVLPNYPIQNYQVPSDYQKYPYPMKDYPRQGAINSQNSGILKYSEHNVSMQEKYSPKQGQYQSGALLQKGLCVPSISSNISSVQNPYLNPQFSRDYQWENHEKDSNKIQNPVPMHSAYPKYQMYQQKYAMQRFSMENHLRELSRIPGYQSHPKYQECILRYRELLRLQQTVDYQSAFQNSLTSTNSSVPPINLQFDQNGVLINSNYLPGNFPTPHNPTNAPPNSLNPDKEHQPPENLQQLQNLPPRTEHTTVQNPETIPRDVQFLNQKTIENPHCQVAQREEERFETLNSRKDNNNDDEDKNSKNLSSKPDLDVRQFLANWVEVEEEEGGNGNLPDVVLSNSTPIVVVEYGNVGLVTHTPAENPVEQTTKTDNESTLKEYFPKEQIDATNLLQNCSNDLNQGIIYANKLNIKCVGEGIDGVPTIHIVENPEEEFIYTAKAEIEGPGASLPSLTETKDSDTNETKETPTNLNYKKLNPESKLQINPEDLSILPPLAKNNSEPETSNLKKQNSFTNEENQTSDDISLPDLTTSECTPVSTTLNTPTHSDSEECSDPGVDLMTSTNPIELIQNSPMISFTQSPVKIDPYEHLKGENISPKTTLDFDFQSKNQIPDDKDRKNTKTEKSKEQVVPKTSSPENITKDTNEFPSNMDVFSTEDQDKWCWNSLIQGEESETKSQNLEKGEKSTLLDQEKIDKVDDMWLDVGYNIPKGIDLTSEGMTNDKHNNEQDNKLQKNTDIAQVSASVTKILKNIKDRQHFIQNLMHEPINIKRNPKGINIISEEIFNSTWRQNTQNKNYPALRKMSDSFERQELEDFAEKLKYPHRSRSKSLETNSFLSRSKSSESILIDDESRLLNEFKNLKRKRSIDHFQDESKVQKLTEVETVKQTNVEVNSKNSHDEKKVPTDGKSSDLEIKFRNSCDSSKPFEAIKIEINVSRSDTKSEKQTQQKCNEPDYNGNQEEPSSCGSTVCQGKGENLPKVETKCQQKSPDDSKDFKEIGDKLKIQGQERKESVIEYFGKGHHQKISQHAYSCETCKSMNFYKIDKDYLCNHEKSTKAHENNECLMSSSSSTIECLSNRLKSISKSKSLEDVKKKNSRKHKTFANFDNRSDNIDDDKIEMLACTSDSSGFRNSQIDDDLSDKSEDAKHFVIKNSNCDSNSFDNSFQSSADNHNSNLLDAENDLGPKGYLNPLFNSLEDVENLNAVPIYTTKDGKITYSPNPRFTYRTLLMEAREKECQAQLSNYSSSQEKRAGSSKSSEKHGSKQANLKPPKKSLAKRFATQELEKSYQRYLSHRNRKASVSSEPMLIKTIKNYSALNEGSSGNEGNDSKVNSNTDFEDIHLQIEREISRNSLKEQSSQERSVSDGTSSTAEEENQIERVSGQVYPEIQSPVQGEVEDNQVVPVAVHDKDSSTESESAAKNNSANHEKSTQELLNPVENSLPTSEVDCSIDFGIRSSEAKTISEEEIRLKYAKEIKKELNLMNTSPNPFHNLFTRRKSISDVSLQLSKTIPEKRRKSIHEFPIFTSINPEYQEKEEVTPNAFIPDQENYCEDKNSRENIGTENNKDDMEIDDFENVENIELNENEIQDKIGDKIRDKIGDKIRDKIGDKMGDKIGEKVQDKIEDKSEGDNVGTESNIAQCENLSNVNKQNENDEIRPTDIITTEKECTEREKAETEKIKESSLERDIISTHKEQTIEKEISILNIDSEEKKNDLVPEASSAKNDTIEIIEIEDDDEEDDDIFIVEPKLETFPCTGTVEKFDETQVIETENKVEVNSENSLKTTEEGDLKSESSDQEIGNENPSISQEIPSDLVKQSSEESELKLENTNNDDEIQEIDFSSTPSVPVKEAISNKESSHCSETNHNNCSSNPVNEDYLKIFNSQSYGEPTNFSANKLSDFEREVEILTEIIERHESENFTVSEKNKFTDDNYLEGVGESKNKFQQNSERGETNNRGKRNFSRENEESRENCENQEIRENYEYRGIKESNQRNQEIRQNYECQEIKESDQRNQEILQNDEYQAIKESNQRNQEILKNYECRERNESGQKNRESQEVPERQEIQEIQEIQDIQDIQEFQEVQKIQKVQELQEINQECQKNNHENQENNLEIQKHREMQESNLENQENNLKCRGINFVNREINLENIQNYQNNSEIQENIEKVRENIPEMEKNCEIEEYIEEVEGNNQEYEKSGEYFENQVNFTDIQENNHNYESDLKTCEREYFETRGLSPLLEMNSNSNSYSNSNFNNSKSAQDLAENERIENCSLNENKIENQSDFQINDSPLITEKSGEKHDTNSIYIDDDSYFEVDPPILEVQRELNDSDILNSSKSSDSNEFNKMPDVTLEGEQREKEEEEEEEEDEEESKKRENQSKNSVVEKMVPKLVIRKIEMNRNILSKSKSTESNIEPSFHRKIPKMIIRNAKSRPTTPTIEEIPEEFPLSQEESNVIKVKIRLDDINKNDSYIFSNNEENRIPKMKIKLEDKLPKVVIKNLDIRNTQDLQKLVPKVKIKKLKNLHTITDNTNENSSIINNSELNQSRTIEDTENIDNPPPVDDNETKPKIPKLKIKKDLKINSMTRKRHNSDITSSSSSSSTITATTTTTTTTTTTENKKIKRSSRDEIKQDRRIDPITENSLSSSEYQNISEKIPKVIIKRASPTAEFKCEVSNDKKNTSAHDLSLQPQVVLQRSWILDCMAKELKHVNIALKLAIAKNGGKASVRGKSNTSKIRWEQFIRSLKKQKELSRTETNSQILSGKIKRRRKSDMEIRYFQSEPTLYNFKASKSARESTIQDTNYLNNRALYFKNMFTENIKNYQNTYDNWKKFDENMNSENKEILQSEKFDYNFDDLYNVNNIETAEVKLNQEIETKCPLLNPEEVENKLDESKFDLSSVNDIQNGIKIEDNVHSQLMANGEHEHLYFEDAIPTQFEFELEIVDSSVDTYDVPMSDSKEFFESLDSVDMEDSQRFQKPQLPEEENLLVEEEKSRDDSCDIKDEIPILNDFLTVSENTKPCGSKFTDSMSLVQEVMAAKEILKKYLPNCRTDNNTTKSRPKTLAEKKQGTDLPSIDYSSSASTRVSSEYLDSRNNSKSRKRTKESSSRERCKNNDPYNYDHHNTISLRDQKRSSLQTTTTRESSNSRVKHSKSSESNSKCSSRSKSSSRSQKSRESSKESSRDTSRDNRSRDVSRDNKDCDLNKMKSYKIPKISKSKDNNIENVIEVKAKEEMPILEPEGGVNLDPSLVRDTSRSPPVITIQDDVEIIEDESKIFNANVKKEDRNNWKMKSPQIDPGGTLADAVQNWVFHEKATIKHRRYCVLCERWFPSVIRHRRHLSGYQHRHTELTQRRTIHTLFMLFTGKPCPRLLPADVLRSDCSLGEATPLQIAVQNVALGYGNAHDKSESKDDEERQK